MHVNAFGAARRRRSRLNLSAALAAFLSLAVMPSAALLRAQEGGKPPAGTPPAVPAAEAKETAKPLSFGRIVGDKVPLRCWPGNAAQPPVFEDVLEKGQVVALGRSENGFRAVALPLGPVGYVSRKFTDTTPEGTVKTKGTKVAFRYRPRSSEAPVTTLGDATPLHVVGEQPDWYRVRVPAIEAWVAEAEVQAADAADSSLTTAWAEFEARQQAEVKARLDGIAAARRLEEQNKADLAAVQVIQDRFVAEMGKPVAEQKYAEIDEALDKVTAALGPESAARPIAKALEERIETQRWVAEATIVRDEKPAPVAGPTAEPTDRFARFQSIGWLRYERRLGGPGIYYLEKGGRRQYLVSCNTGRYDLALFVDREVGIAGPRRRPAAESLSVLDAERLEVLGTVAR